MTLALVPDVGLKISSKYFGLHPKSRSGNKTLSLPLFPRRDVQLTPWQSALFSAFHHLQLATPTTPSPPPTRWPEARPLSIKMVASPLSQRRGCPRLALSLNTLSSQIRQVRRHFVLCEWQCADHEAPHKTDPTWQSLKLHTSKFQKSAV